MTTLVTGASGFLGSALVRRLCGEGQTVRALLRSRSRRDLLSDLTGRFEIAVGDVSDAESVADALTGVSMVYHCAAHIGFDGGESSRRMMEVNVRGTANVVDESARAGISRLVHVSSVAALGQTGATGNPVDESAEWSDSSTNTAYGRSKYLSELEVHRAVAEGLDAVIVNPALVFGPGRPGENTMQIVEAVRDGRAWGYPTGATNVVDVDDVAAGMTAAMRTGAAGRRYILAGEHLSWKQILGTLADAFGVSLPHRRLSPAVMQIAAFAAETLAMVTRAEPRLTRESARLSAAVRCYDSTRARSELRWSPRPFAETAARIAHSHPAPSR